MAALSRVQLWEGTISERGGLDVPLDDDMLSQGQKQLFFLARAILRKGLGRILLLDEVSSR